MEGSVWVGEGSAEGGPRTDEKGEGPGTVSSCGHRRKQEGDDQSQGVPTHLLDSPK